MKASRFFKTTSLVWGVVILLGLLVEPSMVYSQSSGGFYPLYGNSGYEVRRINPSTGTTNPWGVHGNVNYYALGKESWFGTDFVGTLKQLYAPFGGTASAGHDPDGGYWVAIEGSGEWRGWFLRVIHVAEAGRVTGAIRAGDPIAKESSTGTSGSHSHVILLWCEDPEGPRSTCKDVPFLAMLDRQYWPDSTYPSGDYTDRVVPGDSELLIPEGAVAPDWDSWPGNGQEVSSSFSLPLTWQKVAGVEEVKSVVADVVESAGEGSLVESLLKLAKAYGWQGLSLFLFILLLAKQAELKRKSRLVDQLLKAIKNMTGREFKLIPSAEVSRREKWLYRLYLVAGVAMGLYVYLNPGWVWVGVFKDLAVLCLVTWGVGWLCQRFWESQVKRERLSIHPTFVEFAKVVMVFSLVFPVAGYLVGMVEIFHQQYGEVLSEAASQQSLRQIAVKAVGEAANKAVELAVDGIEAKTREIAPDWLEKLLFEESEGSDSSTGSDAEGVNQEAADIIAANAALEKGCPPDLIYGLWVTETNDVRCTDPGADCVSDAGAKGPLQFMDDTWPHYSEPGWDRNDLGDSTRAACRLVKAIGLFTSDDVHTFQKKFTSSGTKRPCWNLGEPGPQVDGWDQAIEVWQIMRSRPVTKNH